jgi:PAS domain S-box-containing protein
MFTYEDILAVEIKNRVWINSFDCGCDNSAEDVYDLSYELPGVRKENIDLQVTKQGLKLLAERNSVEYVNEFAFAWDADADKVQALYENGLLSIRVPLNCPAVLKNTLHFLDKIDYSLFYTMVVLCIEDEQITSRLIERMIEKADTRFSVKTAGSLQEARAFLSDQSPDIIITDIFLPDGKGTEIILETQKAPVIAVTGKGNEALAVEIMKAGAADYIIKETPEFQKLPARVLEIVSEKERSKHISQAEIKLETLREHIPTILETMLDAVVVVNIKGEIIYTNRQAAQILKLKMDEVLGTYFYAETWGSIDEKGNPFPKEKLPLYQALTLKKKVPELEHGLLHEDGSETWLSINAAPLYDREKTLMGAVATFRDITEQKEMERAFDWKKRFVQAIENTTGTLLIVLDTEGRVVRFNRACERATGYTFSELEGKHFWDYLIPEQERDEVKMIFENLRSGKYPLRHENYWKKKDGGMRYIAWNNTVMSGRDGEVEYILGAGVDITDEKEENEERIRELRRDLAALEQIVTSSLSSVTAAAFGQKPLEEGNPELFKQFVDLFSEILDDIMEERAYRTDKGVANRIRRFSDKLGFAIAGPKDLISIYSTALQKTIASMNPAKARGYKEEGRLLLLEVMGNLTSFYRKYYPAGTGKESSS